ncbi:MAG: peptide MFS transporter [Alphaproteobacteria bacterium]|nr:peptide MFS transporter [Alphaproteobacteria bacterium]
MLANQPKPFSTLFIMGMWESFSIYGLRALFALYLASELFFSDHKAYEVYGTFGALLYSLPFIGGWISDRGLGLRRSIIMGSLIMIVGFAVLLLPFQNAFYSGMGMIICGYAFFKPNLTSMLGKIYQTKDLRRDAGFSLVFAASNGGAFISPLICGYIAYHYSWKYAFAITSTGIIGGLLIFLKKFNLFASYDQEIHNRQFLKFYGVSFKNLIYLSILPVIFILSLLIGNSEWMNLIMPLTFCLIMIWLLKLAFRSSRQERSNIFTLLVLLGFVLIFDICFEQAWSSINFLVERAVARTIYGFKIPTAWFLGINPLLVVILAPLFSMLWFKLAQHKYHISVEIKFIIGLLTLALGFAGLFAGTKLPDSSGLVNPWWIFFGYAFHTIGELCIIPVGISMVSKLAPSHYASTFMGFWYFIWAFSHYLGGQVAKLTSTNDIKEICNLLKCRTSYGDIFGYMAFVLVGLSLLLLAFRPYLRPTFPRF